MGSSFSNSLSSKPDIPLEGTGSSQSKKEYVNLEKNQILSNQLSNYLNCLYQSEMSLVQKSFMRVAQSYIINTMGKKQIESYFKYNSFTMTDLNIMRSIHKLPHFNTDKNLEVKHLLDPLKKSFIKGSLQQVQKDIQSAKYIQEYKHCSLTTMEYRLLDILGYMADVCLTKDKMGNNDAFSHWLNIFELLFRRTNIKISNDDENSNIIIFKYYDQHSNINNIQTILTTNTSLQNFVELSCCLYTVKDQKDTATISTMMNEDDRETIDQNKSILLNKTILDKIIKLNDEEDNELHILYSIGIHLVGFSGYIYSIKNYKGAYIASQVCENTIFIPQTLEEFQSLLFQDRVLEMLCNLKRCYVGIAKTLRTANRA